MASSRTHRSEDQSGPLASTSAMNEHTDIYVHVHVPRAASDSQLLSFKSGHDSTSMQRSFSASSHLSSSSPAYKRAGSLHLHHSHPSSSSPSSPRGMHIHIHPADDRPTASRSSGPISPSGSSFSVLSTDTHDLASEPSTPASSVAYEPIEVETEVKDVKLVSQESASERTLSPSRTLNGSLSDSTVTGALDCATSPTFGAKSTASSSPLAALQDPSTESHPIVRAIQAGQISLDALLAFPVNWNNLAQSFVTAAPSSPTVPAPFKEPAANSPATMSTHTSKIGPTALQTSSRTIKPSARATRWTAMFGDGASAPALPSIPEVDLSSTSSPSNSTISMVDDDRPLRRRRTTWSLQPDAAHVTDMSNSSYTKWQSLALASSATVTPPVTSSLSFSSTTSTSSACSSSSMDLVELSSCEVREPRLGPVDLPPLEDFGWYSGCASNPNFSIPRTPLDMDQACMWGKNNAMGLSGLNVENERLKEGLNATLAQWPFSAPSFEHQAGLATGLARGQSGGLGLSLVA